VRERVSSGRFGRKVSRIPGGVGRPFVENEEQGGKKEGNSVKSPASMSNLRIEKAIEARGVCFSFNGCGGKKEEF